jgi:prepilin-type N-terminal cleavage/methylation domain-containing protein
MPIDASRAAAVNLREFKRRGDNDVDADVPDEGFSLVEVVITIVLIGIVVIPLLIASATGVTASSRTREAAETETVLQNAADRLNRAIPSCDYDPYVVAALKAKGWDPTLYTTAYEYYEPGSSVLASTPGSWVSGRCPEPTPDKRRPMLIQRVTITVNSPSRLIKQTIRVIKNDV